MKTYEQYKDSSVVWVGDIPAHWEIQKGRRLFKKMSRPVRPEDDVVTCFRDGTVTLRKNRREDGFTNALQEIGYQGIRKGDLVIHAMDAFAGAIGVSDSDGKGTPVYSVCQPIKYDNPFYFTYLIREMSRSKYIFALAKGIRERSTDFRYSEFASLAFPVPPLEEQQAIVRFLERKLERINDFIDRKKRLIALLQEQKAALINQVVTKGLNAGVPMKDSGLEWLGEIPAHWTVARLGKIAASLQTGPFGSQLHSAEYIANGIPVINPSHMKNMRLNPDLECSVPVQIAEKLSRHKIQENDILFARRGEMGRCAYVVFEEEGWLCGTGSLRMRPFRDTVFSPYLVHILSSRGIAESLSLVSVGSTMENLNTSILAALQVPLPAVEEQIKITKYIEKESTMIQKAIATIEKEIELILEYRTTLIADCVTGKIDVRTLA
jgi:type I restriction enzyme, S subunit